MTLETGKQVMEVCIMFRNDRRLPAVVCNCFGDQRFTILMGRIMNANVFLTLGLERLVILLTGYP